MVKEDEKREPEEAAAEPPETKPSRRRIVIVGAGQTGRALIRNLSDTWEISVLDVDPVKLDRLREELSERAMLLLAKDGTSLINLREAGLEGAEWLAALTDHDRANIEACRLALSVEPPLSAIGVLRQKANEAELKATGAETLTRPTAIAGLVKNRVERGQQVAINVGLGKGEIVEIPVLPSSPAVNARVRDLRAGRWLIAAIYRDDKILVPH
ncbi:MAG: potassium channel family protein, partial [Acidobacteriota bacterium]